MQATAGTLDSYHFEEDDDDDAYSDESDENESDDELSEEDAEETRGTPHQVRTRRFREYHESQVTWRPRYSKFWTP